MIINTTIRNVCKKLQTGKTPPTTEKKYFNGDINWYTPGDLNSRLLKKSKRTITTLAYKNKKAITYPQGTVLLSCIGDIGKVGITTNTISSSNQQITGLIPDSSKINAEYLYYWCLKHKSLLESKATSAVVSILNNRRLNNIPISYEKDLEKQQKIASFLTRIETLIQKREESIQLLDELIKSTFLDMFGDPVLNPKGWEKKTCIDVASCIVPGRDKPKSFSGKTAWVTTNDLIDKSYIDIDRDNYLGLSNAEIKEVKAKIIPKDSVIFTCVGDLGIVSIVNEAIVMNQQLHSFQCFDYTNNIFIMYNISFQKYYMYKYASKTTVPYMNKKICNKIPVILPPKPLQDKFASIVTKIETTKAKYQSSLDELNNLFNSTAQKAFKGELNLGNIEVIEKEISKEEAQVLDENKVLELIQSGSFEAKNHVNEKQSYDDIRDMVLKLMDEGKITQKFTDDKKMVLEAKN